MEEIKKVLDSLTFDERGRITSYTMDRRTAMVRYFDSNGIEAIELSLKYDGRLMNEIVYSEESLTSKFPLTSYDKEAVQYFSTVSQFYMKNALENHISIEPFDVSTNVSLMRSIADQIEEMIPLKDDLSEGREPKLSLDSPEKDSGKSDKTEEVSETGMSDYMNNDSEILGEETFLTAKIKNDSKKKAAKDENSDITPGFISPETPVFDTPSPIVPPTITFEDIEEYKWELNGRHRSYLEEEQIARYEKSLEGEHFDEQDKPDANRPYYQSNENVSSVAELSDSINTYDIEQVRESEVIQYKNESIATAIAKAKEETSSEPTLLSTANPELGDMVLKSVAGGGAFYMNNEFLENTSGFESESYHFNDTLKEKVTVLSEFADNKEDLLEKFPEYGKASYIDYQNAELAAEEYFASRQKYTSYSASINEPGGEVPALATEPDAVLFGYGGYESISYGYEETVDSSKKPYVHFQRPGLGDTDSSHEAFEKAPIETNRTSHNTAETGSPFDNSSEGDAHNEGPGETPGGSQSSSTWKEPNRDYKHGIKPTGYKKNMDTLGKEAKGQLVFKAKRFVKQDADLYAGYRTHQEYFEYTMLPVDLIVGAGVANAVKASQDAAVNILKEAGLIDKNTKNFTEKDFNFLAQKNGMQKYMTSNNGRISALLKGKELSTSQISDIKKELRIRKTGVEKPQLPLIPKKHLYTLLRGNNLNQKQIAILKAKKIYNQSRNAAKTRWGGKNKGKKGIKKLERKFFYSFAPSDTTLEFYMRFARPRTIGGMAAKAALKAGYYTTIAAGSLVAQEANRLRWNGLNYLYNHNENYAKFVKNRKKKKYEKRKSKLKRHNRIIDERNRKIKTIKKSAKRYSYDKAKKILGQKNFGQAMKSVRKMSGTLGAIQNAKNTVKSKISGAIAKITGKIGEITKAVKGALLKYILIPVLCILFILLVVCVAQGPLISALMVFDQHQDLVYQVQTKTKKLNEDFERKLLVSSMRVEDITTGITDSDIYNALSGSAANVIAYINNSANNAKSYINQKFGTDLDVGNNLDAEDIIMYIDNYRISVVDGSGQELEKVDLNNDGTILSMAAVYTMSDILGKVDNLTFKNQFLNYADLLWHETHRYGVVITEKGPCEYGDITWAENHSFTCTNGSWGPCEEASSREGVNIYKNGTHNGESEGAYHIETRTSTHESPDGTITQNTYTVHLPCNGSDVYWHCPGHVDVETKVTVGSFEKSENNNYKIDAEQMEKDKWVFSMDLFGSSELISDISYIINFQKNIMLNAGAMTLAYISEAAGWEPLAEGFWEDSKYFIQTGVNPETRWKGWFDPKEWEGYWTRVRLYFDTGENVDKNGKTGWETLYGYSGEEHFLYSGVIDESIMAGSMGYTTATKQGSATKEEIQKAISNYTLSPLQETLMDYSMMAADAHVPYYWDGKPKSQDIGNVLHFGTPTSDDGKGKGRTRRGLDCSGFICWTYWSAGAMTYKNLGTSDLKSSLPTCSVESMVPGDIIVKDGHVRLFAGFDDGYYYFVESSSSHNQVVYSKFNGIPAEYVCKSLAKYR